MGMQSLNKFTSLRISADLLGRAAAIAEELPGMSANAIGVAAVEAILEMIDTPPEKRTVPSIVAMVDSVRAAKNQRITNGTLTAEEKAERLRRKG